MSYSHALEEQLRLLRGMRLNGSRLMEKLARERGVDPDIGRVMADLIEITLESAEPYYWSPEMCDVLASVSETMPMWTIRTTDFLTPAGFMHFAKPLPVRWFVEDGQPAAPVAAIAWYVEPGSEAPNIILSVFVQVDGRTIPFSAFAVADGDNVALLAGNEVGGGDIEMDVGGDIFLLVLQHIGAAVSLCQQRIIVTPQERADRATRRRIDQSWQHEPLIRVVQLRKASGGQDRDGDGRAVDWSCRWIVSGHWRQQYYPSTDDHKPIWVLPYVKGPESAPLKAPRAKVFEVVR